jgi:crossover junction endodeoxyribonuclease RuvC
MENRLEQKPLRVLGIDPGYGRLGLALIEKKNGKETLIYSDCLVSSRSTPFPLRVAYLGEEVEKLLQQEKPNAVGIEKLFLVKNLGTTNRNNPRKNKVPPM